ELHKWTLDKLPDVEAARLKFDEAAQANLAE
ncbi:transcriptional regulator, partial [Pseudomonas syringae]